MTDDVAKLADKLNENMAHAVKHAFGGGINCDVSLSTQRALVRRGVAAWDSDQEDGTNLTPLGLEAKKYLLAKAEAEQVEASKARMAVMDAEGKIRDEGYEAGARWARDACLLQLNQAVYGCDNWPDRPHDSVWDHLIETVCKQFQTDLCAATSVAPSEASQKEFSS